MPLDPDKVKELIAKKDAPKHGGGGRKAANSIDTSVRTYETWFKLGHKIFDEENPNNAATCENPECPSVTAGAAKTLVAEVNGVFMCRHCFLEGWKLESPEQLTMTDG